MRKSLAMLTTSALALSACAPTLQEAPLDAAASTPTEWRTSLKVTAPAELDWWNAFGDPQLSQLVEQARLNNPDVQIAASRVEEARATEMGSRGYLLPSVGVGVEGGVQREVSPFGQSRTTVAAQPTFRASYEVDLFGKNAARLDAAQAVVAASAADEEAARLSVSAATASGYITLLALDKRLQVLEATLDARGQALKFARDRSEVGYTSQLERRQAEAEYQAAAQLIPQLKAQISRQENALSILTIARRYRARRDAGGAAPALCPGDLAFRAASAPSRCCGCGIPHRRSRRENACGPSRFHALDQSRGD